jgi:predicted phage terminase large subunit-like protein
MTMSVDIPVAHYEEGTTLDPVEVLQRRDEEAAAEIEKDLLEQEATAQRLRDLEAAERQMLKDQPQELARREAARRVLCRRNFLPFVMRFNPDYQPGWVHKDICRRLEKFSRDVELKRSPRLLITVPPRHGKSVLTSKTFAAWHLGKYPRHEFITCSYSGSLSLSFSRIVRNTLRDPAYHRIFDTRLHPESQGAEAWLTTDGGGFVSAGIGGAITGKGAHVLVIDDPVKNREDAESGSSRENAYDWYTSTAYTRLSPGGGVVLILTRWHDDDLAGRLLKKMKEGGESWEIVNYPAQALEDETYRNMGEALHPERYDEKALARIRATIGERDWAALYQQQPVLDEGAYFKQENFLFYDYNDPDAVPPPDAVVNYVAWDLAVGKKQINDWGVGIVVSIDRNEELWVREVVRDRWDSLEVVDQMFSIHRKWRPGRTGIEKGVIEMSIAPYLTRAMREQKMWDFRYTPLENRGQDKIARARAIQGMLDARKIHLPHNAAWTKTFLEEVNRFPYAAHDDQADAFAWIGQMIMLMNPKPLIQEKKKSWRDRLPGHDGEYKSAMSA